jgi:2-methylisocitrate lyase-like PEP mutase family enzyme
MSNAETFHNLHASGFLVLPNCWDAGSARVIETMGARAVATSSAAVCWALGYADGHHLPVDLLIESVGQMTRVVSIPVTCDFEGGYADDPAQVAENIVRVVGAGAVGVNLEDGRVDADLHARKIEAAREAATKAGVNLFINARTDVFLKALVPPEQMLAETLRRAALYRDAGASGLFAPFAVEESDIATLATECGLPLNVIAKPGMPHAARLEQLGARRLSSGTGLARAALNGLKAATANWLATGDSDALSAAGGEPVDYNKLFL